MTTGINQKSPAQCGTEFPRNLFGGSQFPVFGGVGFVTGRLTFLSRSRTMSERSKSRSSAESLSENCFCKCAGCVKMNNSSTSDRYAPGNNPMSTPSRMSDSRFIVSLDEMLCAFARMP